MPSKIFTTQEDFQSRVTETIVTLDGDIFWAMPSSKTFHLSLSEFPTGKVVHPEVHVDDDRLFIGALPLGLVNQNGHVFHVSRIPARRYRYGTPPQHLAMESLTTSVGFKGDIFSVGFREMLQGVYPTVAEALAAIRASGGKNAFAVSRSFFIRENALGLVQVHFKDLGPILWITPNGDVTFVEKSPTSRYLTQCNRQLQRIIQELRNHAL